MGDSETVVAQLSTVMDVKTVAPDDAAIPISVGPDEGSADAANASTDPDAANLNIDPTSTSQEASGIKNEETGIPSLGEGGNQTSVASESAPMEFNQAAAYDARTNGMVTGLSNGSVSGSHEVQATLAEQQFEDGAVDLMGNQDQIAKAEKLINKVLAAADAGGPGSVSRRMPRVLESELLVLKVPNNKVIVPPGETPMDRTVQIDDTSEQIEIAKQMVNEVIEIAYFAGGFLLLHSDINSISFGFIKGKGVAWILVLRGIQASVMVSGKSLSMWKTMCTADMK